MNAREPRDDVHRALRRLAASAVPAEQPNRLAERRERLLPGLSAFAAAEFSRSERRTKWPFVAAAAVALAAGFAGAGFLLGSRRAVELPTLRTSEGVVRVLHGGDSAVAHAPLPLAASDLLETGDGTAEVSLVTGAVVDLDARSRLELRAVDRSAGAAAERIELSRGRVSVHVPKLPAGSKLMVGTPDATVTVHGTAFSVAVQKSPEGSMTTRVTVTEGRVSVESGGRQLFLGPGSEWSSAPVSAEMPSAEAALAPSSAPSPGGPPDDGAPRGASRRSSTLRDENELFRAAIAARRDGDLEKTIVLADRLMHTYPTSPLAAATRALRSEVLGQLRRSPAP